MNNVQIQSAQQQLQQQLAGAAAATSSKSQLQPNFLFRASD